MLAKGPGLFLEAKKADAYLPKRCRKERLPIVLSERLALPVAELYIKRPACFSPKAPNRTILSWVSITVLWPSVIGTSTILLIVFARRSMITATALLDVYGFVPFSSRMATKAATLALPRYLQFRIADDLYSEPSIATPEKRIKVDGPERNKFSQGHSF